MVLPKGEEKMSILCLLGLHKWKHNSHILRSGTVRVCMRCNKRQEWHVMGDFDRTSFWREVKK